MDAEALIRDGAAKVEAIVREAGPKVAEAAEHVVRYNWASALTAVILASAIVTIVMSIAAYSITRCIRIVPTCSTENDAKLLGIIVPALATALALGIGCDVIHGNLPIVLEPYGYTVKQIMGVR